MLDQFRGCLLGLACGEALGRPVRSLSAAEISRRFGKVREMLGGGWLKLPPGSVSEATELALHISDSYLQCGGFNAIDQAERFLQWYRTAPVAVGHLTGRACAVLDKGYHFERAARDALEDLPESLRLTNESLKRAAPTGLLRYHDHVHLIGESRVISGITHCDERCKLACVCLNLAIAHLLLVGVDGLQDELLEFIEPRNTVIGYALKALPSLSVRELRNTDYVLDTLQTALWVTLYCDELEEGLVLLVNLGGDTAALGAVGGALLGARFGRRQLPEHWLEPLQHREYIDETARALHRQATE